MHALKSKLKTALAFVLVFGIAALVLLYFLGYYDFSFLDRYKLLGDTGGVQDVGGTVDDVFSSLAVIKPDSVSDDAEAGEDEAVAVGKEYKTNTKNVYYTSELEDALWSIAKLDGGMETVEEFGEGSRLVKMTFDYRLPERIALSIRSATRETVIFPEDDSEPYVKTSKIKEARYAVELYMGYILMDSGEDIILIDGDGVPLSRFPYDKYSPAYMRDKDGKPVFERVDGGESYYYTLAEDGKSFISCAVEDLANVPLNFDYSADYGMGDSTSVYAEKGESGLYSYSVKDADGEKVGSLTGERYTSAYAYTENRATVTEKGAERGAVSVINENGSKAFDSIRVYVNKYDRYVKDFYLPPLTSGIESVGYYYFDNGLTRLRKQTVDYYNYAVRGVVRVVEDKSILVNADGEEYDIPYGFTLEGYSDGVLLLEKDGKYGFYSTVYGWIAQPIYRDAQPFVGGLAVLTAENGKMGMITTDGEIILPFTYDHISQNSSGSVAAYRSKNGWTVFKIVNENEA